MLRMAGSGAVGPLARALSAAFEGHPLNTGHLRPLVEDSIGLVTALVPALGYEVCSRVAKQALAQKRRVADIVLEEKLLTEEQMSRLFRPDAMTSPARPM